MVTCISSTVRVSGVTHMCSGNGQPDPPHPACPPTLTSKNGSSIYASSSRWSGYRFHEKDPLWFEDGVQLLVRNGDVGGPVPYGSAKCYNVCAKCVCPMALCFCS